MENKYQFWYTIEITSYGVVASRFRNKIDYDEAVTLGKKECKKNKSTYFTTCSAKDKNRLMKEAVKLN